MCFFVVVEKQQRPFGVIFVILERKAKGAFVPCNLVIFLEESPSHFPKGEFHC